MHSVSIRSPIYCALTHISFYIAETSLSIQVLSKQDEYNVPEERLKIQQKKHNRSGQKQKSFLGRHSEHDHPDALVRVLIHSPELDLRMSQCSLDLLYSIVIENFCSFLKNETLCEMRKQRVAMYLQASEYEWDEKVGLVAREGGSRQQRKIKEMQALCPLQRYVQLDVDKFDVLMSDGLTDPEGIPLVHYKSTGFSLSQAFKWGDQGDWSRNLNFLTLQGSSSSTTTTTTTTTSSLFFFLPRYEVSSLSLFIFFPLLLLLHYFNFI
tara:strand:- start:149 stop:949 length:801 start_codon:yes stop_codon:yes gene_type:complete